MSEKMQKLNWRRNWERARDNERAAAVANDIAAAGFWCRVAGEIEAGFSEFFNQDFGEYLAGV